MLPPFPAALAAKTKLLPPLLLFISTLRLRLAQTAEISEISVIYTEILSLPKASVQLDVLWNGLPLNESHLLSVCDNRHPPTFAPTSLFCGPFEPDLHDSGGFTDCAAENGFTSETINKETCIALGCCFDPTFNPTCRNKLERPLTSWNGRRMAESGWNATDQLPRCDGIIMQENDANAVGFHAELGRSSVLVKQITKEMTLPLLFRIASTGNESHVIEQKVYDLAVCPFGYRFSAETHSCQALCGAGSPSSVECFCGGSAFLDVCKAVESCSENSTYNGTICVETDRLCIGMDTGEVEDECESNRNICKLHEGFRFNGSLCMPETFVCEQNYLFDPIKCEVYQFTPAPTRDIETIPTASPTSQVQCGGNDCYCGSNGFDSQCPTCVADVNRCPSLPLDAGSTFEFGSPGYEAIGQVCVNTDPTCIGFRSVATGLSEGSMGLSALEQTQLYPLDAVNSSCNGNATFPGFLRSDLPQDEASCAQVEAQVVVIVDLSRNVLTHPNSSYDELLDAVDTYTATLNASLTNLTIIAIHSGETVVAYSSSSPRSNATSVRSALDSLPCCQGPCVLVEALAHAEAVVQAYTGHGSAWVVLFMAGKPSPPEGIQESTYTIQAVGEAFESLKSMQVEVLGLAPEYDHDYYIGWPLGLRRCSVLGFSQACHSVSSPPFPLVPVTNLFKLEVNETQQLRSAMCRTAQEMCLSLCAAGWEWDAAKQRCMPIQHTCYEGHQLNLKSCEVAICPTVLDLDAVVYLNPERTVLRVELTSSMTLTQVNVSVRSSNLIAQEDTANNAKVVAFVPLPPLAYIPHGEYHFEVSAASTCGLQQGIFPTYTVANRAPVITTQAQVTKGSIGRVEEDIDNAVAYVEVRTAAADKVVVYLVANVTEPDGEGWVLDWATSGLSNAAQVDVTTAANRIMVVPLALGSWNVTAQAMDQLGLASSMKVVVNVVGYQPPEVSLEGSIVKLSLGSLSVGLLDASTSTDDGRIVTFNWSVVTANLDPIPSFDAHHNATTRLVDLVDGHTVIVRIDVTDDDGLVTNASTVVTVSKDISTTLPVEIETNDVEDLHVYGEVVMPHLYITEETTFRVVVVDTQGSKSIAEAWFNQPKFSIALPLVSTAREVRVVAEVYSRGKSSGFQAQSDAWTVDVGVNFRVGVWGECSMSCGSGTQSRSVTCVDRLGKSLPVGSCDAVLGAFNRPETLQTCFAASSECEGSAYGFEEAVCGCGERCRDVRCRSVVSGEPSQDCREPSPLPQASWAKPCEVEATSTEVVYRGEVVGENVCICYDDGHADSTEGVCVDAASQVVLGDGECSNVVAMNTSTPACSCHGRSWGILSTWSNCFEATSSRVVRCVQADETSPADLTLLPDLSCTHLAPKPVSQRACPGQTQPGSAWVVSRWSPCDRDSCLMRRSVDCFNLTTQGRTNSCNNASKPVDASACDVYEACMNGTESRVDQSGLPLTGRGLEDPDTCATVQRDGTCCTGDQAVLDKDGRCCNSGELNACGSCEASGVPDVRGECCASGVLDAQGVCCMSGVIDACGVCDGTGLSCGVELVVEVLRSDASRLLDAEAQVLAVIPNTTTVDLYANPPDTMLQLHRRDKQPWEDTAALVAVITAINSSASLPVRLAQSPTQAFRAKRVGTCGNGVCEVGEAAWEMSDTSASCFEDCPWRRTLACPRVNGTVCNGQGICLYLSGECSCFEPQGYTGTACSQCSFGFQWSGDRCVAVPSVRPLTPTRRPSLPTNTPSTTQAPSVIGYIGLGAGIVLSILLVLATYMVIRYRRSISGSHVDKSPIVVPEKGEDEDPTEGDGGDISGYPPGIRKEGWLRRWTKGEGWGQKEYYVLDGKLRALRFFTSVVESTPFNVYTGELGSIALKHLVFVRSDDKHLRVFHLAVRVATEEEEQPVLVKLLSRSKTEKKEWVEEISYFVADDSMKTREARTHDGEEDSNSDDDSDPELIEATTWEGDRQTRTRQSVGSFEIALV